VLGNGVLIGETGGGVTLGAETACAGAEIVLTGVSAGVGVSVGFEISVGTGTSPDCAKI